MAERTNGGLTEDEQRVMGHLARAWDAYVALPRADHHATDQFMTAINSAQSVLALRVVARLLSAVPDGDPLRRLRAWQQVERQVSFISHLLEDLGMEVRRG